MLLLSWVSADFIVQLVELMLADEGILFVSKSPRKVSESIQAFVALLFPFEFQHKIQPLAPPDQPRPYKIRFHKTEDPQEIKRLEATEFNIECSM